MISFYEIGLGLKCIGEFYNYEGYDGVMFGLLDEEYYLEFIIYVNGSLCLVLIKDNLLVFYMFIKDEIEKIVN